jgi:hypothetical protein
MIEILEKFDRAKAAGVLARAAFSIEDDSNPAAALKWPEEEGLRREVLNEARIQLGLAHDDDSEEATQKLSDFLDIELDRLSSPENTEAVLNALARKGELPSDLFTVLIDSNITDFFGKKFENEQKLIEQTVRVPDREQHYGPSEDRNAPFLISLFAKHFPDKFPYKSFTMLVAAQRKGRFLDVHQAWRIYSDSVDLSGAETLVEMLKRFSDVFGHPITVHGKTANFILTAEVPRGQPIETTLKIEWKLDKNGKPIRSLVTWTHFTQERPFANSMQAALVVSIDLIRYRKELEKHGW